MRNQCITQSLQKRPWHQLNDQTADASFWNVYTVYMRGHIVQGVIEGAANRVQSEDAANRIQFNKGSKKAPLEGCDMNACKWTAGN